MSGSQQPQQSSSSRPGRFPNSRMQPTSNQPPQAPAGFMSQNFHPNNSIWSLSNTRDRNIASRDSDELPSGLSALSTNNDASLWGSNFWSAERNSRPSSTSPNRTRDGGLTNGSGFSEIQHASVGPQRAGFSGNAFQEETNGYHAFVPQRRGEESSVLDQMSNYTTRDSLPPSRQSQGSPAYDLYHGHTPSNSMHSQRPINGHANTLQSANQRAFNINRQLTDEDLASQFSRQATLGAGSNNRTTPFNPASQPFQMNAAQQPWAVNGAGSRLNSIDMNNDSVASPFSNFRRESVDRASPVSNYRLDQGNNSPRGYAPQTDSWTNRSGSRDPRASNSDRRAPAQPYAGYSAPYFAGYPGYQLPEQFQQHIIDPSYIQNMRQAPILPPYGIPLANIHPLANVMRSRERDPGVGMRSMLLDEFRQSKSRRYDLKDIYGHVVEFSGDQHGSRFIQQKLETANSDEKDQVFSEIEPNAIQLMKDVFGNYVIQKFFEHGSQVQKKILAEKMRGKVVSLSLQVYACRVVQKALEHILDEQQAALTGELQTEIVKVIKDQNGNHVVQKAIELVPRRHLDFIMTTLMKSVEEYAKHTFGCRIIQRMLENGTREDKEILMRELHKIMTSLLTDQYGNYVAQHVIENGKPEDRNAVIELALPNLFALSKHKFASNVVEKCIEFGSVDYRNKIRDRLTSVDNEGTEVLGVLIRDQYGNYVIQKLCEFLKGADLEILVEQIKPHYYNIKKNGSSRQIQALEKLLGLEGGSNQSRNLDGVNSSIPTPTLTNEPNSPQSSGPPSTNASAVGAPIIDDDDKHGGAEVGPWVVNGEV